VGWIGIAITLGVFAMKEKNLRKLYLLWVRTVTMIGSKQKSRQKCLLNVI